MQKKSEIKCLCSIKNIKHPKMKCTVAFIFRLKHLSFASATLLQFVCVCSQLSYVKP